MILGGKYVFWHYKQAQTMKECDHFPKMWEPIRYAVSQTSKSVISLWLFIVNSNSQLV